MLLNKLSDVLIIDDKFEDIHPLISIFNKKKISYLYFDSTPDKLPDNPITDFNLLFLDIHLGSVSTNEKNTKAKLISVLTRVVGKKTTPYILFLWSKDDEQNTSLVQAAITESEINPPIATCLAQKKDFFEGNKTEQQLSELLSEKLSNYPAFLFILSWKKQCQESINKINKEIFSNHESDWNQDSYNILHALTCSYAGERNIPTDSQEVILNSSIKFLNEILKDALNDIPQDIFSEISLSNTLSRGKINENVKKTINKLLYLGQPYTIKHTTGNMFKGLYHYTPSQTLRHLLKGDKIKSKMENDIEEELNKQSASWEQSKDIIFYELIVTPLCDFTNKKSKKIRIVPVIFIQEEFLNSKPKDYYLVLNPIFHIENKNYKCVIDLALFTSKTENEFNSKVTLDAERSMRSQVISFIQSELGKHQSRSPVLFIE